MAYVDLVIATPGGSFEREYVHSLLETLHRLSEEKITFAFSNDVSSIVHDAREITLSGSREVLIDDSRPFKGELEYKKILWIDSDISWKPEDVIALYHSEHDIACGVYMFPDGRTSLHREPDKGIYSIEEVMAITEPTEVIGSGFGFMCVKSGVFESLEKPWFNTIVVDVKKPDGSIMKFPILGEDIAWCHRVREKGFKIFFEPTVKVNHHKKVSLSWEGFQNGKA